MSSGKVIITLSIFVKIKQIWLYKKVLSEPETYSRRLKLCKKKRVKRATCV